MQDELKMQLILDLTSLRNKTKIEKTMRDMLYEFLTLNWRKKSWQKILIGQT